MPPNPRYALVFAPEVIDHLDAIERKYHRLIESTIRDQLAFTPERETRNRKPLTHPARFGATWELRFGDKNRFRVFYSIETSDKVVHVLAIGVKEGNRLWIGRKEIDL